MITEKEYREIAKLFTQAVAGFLALLISVIMCILLSSCGSGKTSTRQQTSTHEDSAAMRKDTASASVQVNETEADETTEEVNTHTIDYDTSLPVDSVTGRPPIRRETHSYTNKTNKKNKVKQTVAEQQAGSRQHTVTAKKNKSNVDNETVKEETTVPKWITLGIWGVVALAVIVLIVYFKFRI